MGLTRNPRAPIFTIVFPSILLVLFASVLGEGSDTIEIGSIHVPADMPAMPSIDMSPRM